MSRKIFINYRRAESRWEAGRIRDRLVRDFDPKRIFMDVYDNAIPLGANFEQVIESSVAQCAVMIAVIGKNWLNAIDENGNRCLDNPKDFVRVEIGAALRRNIRVIPLLVNGATMPKEAVLPEDLRPLVWLNGLTITAGVNFDVDSSVLVDAIKEELDKTGEGQLEDPLLIHVYYVPNPYPDGTTAYGLVWARNWVDVRVVLTNPTDREYYTRLLLRFYARTASILDSQLFSISLVAIHFIYIC